jgi:hypothetical protein
MPTVLNAHGSGWSDMQMPPNSVYVGDKQPDRRRGGGVRFKQSKWYNPYKIDRLGKPRDGTREEVIARYRARLLLQPELMAALPELRGKDLVFWCAPLACHADVLLELANLGPT